MKKNNSMPAVNSMFEWIHAVANHPLNGSISVALLLFVATAFGSAIMVTVSEQSPDSWAAQAPLAVVRHQQVLGASYGYGTPSAFMSVGWNNYSSQTKKWNYRIDYAVQYVTNGSIMVNKNLFANNISQSGSTFTGYNLKPKTKYTFIFYSGSNGKGTVLATLVITTPQAPTFGY